MLLNVPKGTGRPHHKGGRGLHVRSTDPTCTKLLPTLCCWELMSRQQISHYFHGFSLGPICPRQSNRSPFPTCWKGNPVEPTIVQKTTSNLFL